MSDHITEAVKAKLELRAQRGLKKYGVTMERDDLSIPDWIRHTQEELLDAAVYLEKLIQVHEQKLKDHL